MPNSKVYVGTMKCSRIRYFKRTELLDGNGVGTSKRCQRCPQQLTCLGADRILLTLEIPMDSKLWMKRNVWYTPTRRDQL